jgi:hypothetical protein
LREVNLKRTAYTSLDPFFGESIVPVLEVAASGIQNFSDFFTDLVSQKIIDAFLFCVVLKVLIFPSMNFFFVFPFLTPTRPFF